MIALTVVALIVTYLVINLAAVAVRNKRAHKFYETKSPTLPVLPNPHIFAGHSFKVIRSRKNWKIMENLHEKYGTSYGFYMMEQPWVATKDLDLIKLVEIDKAHKHINRAFFGLPLHEFNHSMFQIDDDQWRKVRRAISPAFTNHKVRSDEVSSDVESVLAQLADSMERRMNKARETATDDEKPASFVVDARDLFERYALAVIFLITYKQENVINFDCEQDTWTQAIVSGAQAIGHPVMHMSMMFPFLRPILGLFTRFHPSGKTQMRIVNYILKATDINRMARATHTKQQEKLSLATGQQERSFADVKSSGQFKRRLVDTVIDSFLDKKIGYDNFVGSLFFLLAAGFLTTADTLSCLIWQLARHPDIQDKLRQTIIDEGIDADYVMWCINETVRYHPAVPLGTGRILSEDVTVNGQFYAKGSFIMPTTHGIHHDPNIWPEPERFNPDRWRDQANFHPAAFVGFGLGPRNCVGGKLAIHEIKLASRMILTNYRIEMCDETPTEWRFSTPALVYTFNDDPIKVRFSALNKKAPTR